MCHPVMMNELFSRRGRFESGTKPGRRQAGLAPLGTVHGGRLRHEQLQGGQIALEFRFSNKCYFLQHNLQGALSILGLGVG